MTTALTFKDFVRPTDLPQWCTDKELFRAVQAWLCGEPDQRVASYLRVPIGEIKNYTNQPGWHFLEDCVRDDVRKVAYANLTRLTHRCFNIIDQRLERGDPIYGLDGEVVGYRAVKVKDLGNLVSQLMSQAQEMDKRTADPREPDKLDLHELAESLKNYAKEKRFREAKEIDATREAA